MYPTSIDLVVIAFGAGLLIAAVCLWLVRRQKAPASDRLFAASAVCAVFGVLIVGFELIIIQSPPIDF